MKITLLCSDPQHPVNAYLQSWALAQAGTHEVEIIHSTKQINGGDMLFLISCSEIISASKRGQYKFCLLLHASDLPKGRGWSPYIWEVVKGAEFITLCLLEVESKIDSGRIWKKTSIVVPKDALWYEINHLLFTAEVEMIIYAGLHFAKVQPQTQVNTDQATYFPKRTPIDSKIDVNKSIAEQFNLIRVCDPQRFPAYFDHLGKRYLLRVEKINEQ
jgi:methionyl-tRNA formyltransferase